MRRQIRTLLIVLILVVGAMPAMGGAFGATATTDHTASVSIAEIQEPTGDGGASPYAGQNVTTTGTVTAVNSAGFYIQDGIGPYTGVFVAGSADVSAGQTVEITAPVEENFDNTRLNLSASGASLSTTGTAEVPAAITLSTANVSQEAFEGVRVRVTDMTVTATPGQYGEWSVDDGSGPVKVDDVSTGDATTPSTVDSTIDVLVGPLYYSFGEFKIQPSTVSNLTAPIEDSSDVSGPTLTILSYNDIQTAASNPDAMGRLVGAVNDRRAAHDNPTVVIGGGDQVSPNSLSPISNWTTPIDTLNVLDPAAEVVGNHDLDFGFEPVADFSAASEFPWLLANVVTEDGSGVPGTQNYTIVERDGIRVGIVGLVDDAIKGKTAVDFAANGYEVADFSEVGSRIATELKTEQNVDVVVAAAHIGVPESQELAAETDNIDVIVTGDDEVLYPPQVTSGTVITEAVARGEYVGELNLTVGDDAVAMESGRLMTVTENNTMNETARTIVNDSRGKYLSTVAGVSETELDSTFASNYHEETAWGNLVTDAFRAKTGAQVAATNSGGIRGNFVFGPGEVTYDDIYTSLPFGNTLVTKEMSGEKLKELLASQVVTLDSEAGQQYGAEPSLQVSGVTYEYVPYEDAEDIVQDMYVNGEPVDYDQNYTVTVNSYMAGWSAADWDMVNLTTVDRDLTLYGTAAVQYVENNTPVAPEVEGRIQRVNAEVNATATTDGDTVTVHADAPADLARINGTLTLTAADADNVVARETTHYTSNDSIVGHFDASAVDSLVESADTTSLELYGPYDSSEEELVYHEHSRLGADVNVAETIVSTPARGNVTATHTVSVQVGETAGGSALSGVRVDYNASFGAAGGDAGGPAGSSDNVLTFGVDTDGDGVVDLDASSSVSTSGDTDSLLVQNTSGPSISTGDTVIVEYSGVDNPANGSYDVTVTLNPQSAAETTTATLDLGGSTAAPELPGSVGPATDLGSDGLLEDVNGNGEGDIADVIVFFNSRGSATVTDNTAAFDFDGNGEAGNIGDVIALFDEVAA